jgi:hypothetical protein
VRVPALPALALTFVLAAAAALATGPTPQHSSHHPRELAGAERAFATAAAALAQRTGYPR